jgi:7-cyano-7-deazaguanine synthase
MTKKAVILLSGGLDSATVCAVAKKDGFEVYALSFLYGQRHNIELEYAKKQAKLQKVVEHKIIEIDLRAFGGSALTDDIEVPKDRSEKELSSKIPVTYVPARNTIFLSYALAYAETIGSSDIFIGVNALDYSGYPDCRPEYIKTFQKLANLATKAGVEDGLIRINTPLIDLSKSEIIKLGLSLGVDYENTISCYDPLGNKPCGHCDACLLRERGFANVINKNFNSYSV